MDQIVQRPKIIVQVKSYTDMINWDTTTLSPQPLLHRVSDDDIWSNISYIKIAEDWNFHKYPCHTRSVDRCVRRSKRRPRRLLASYSIVVVSFELHFFHEPLCLVSLVKRVSIFPIGAEKNYFFKKYYSLYFVFNRIITFCLF